MSTGQDFKPTLYHRLFEEVEGSYSPQHGYIICVTEIVSCSKGKIQETTAHAVFTIRFKAIVFKPFKGEVLDARVRQLNAHGFFCDAGPVQVFVPANQMPDDFEFDDSTSVWRNVDETIKIEPDCDVRLRVVGVKPEDSFCMGSIAEDYFG